MQSAVIKSLYQLHSWSGLYLGLLIYIICISGLFALFHHEFKPGLRADYSAPVPVSATRLDHAFQQALKKILPELSPETRKSVNLSIRLPTVYHPFLNVDANTGKPGENIHIQLDPVSTKEARQPVSVANDVLTRLHTDLLLPEPVGRYLVGALGIVMLVSVFSGILTHRGMIKDLFTLRLTRSIRLKWTDTHKALGLWGLPFHFMMSLTGAVLGWVGLILLLAAATAFKGDLEQASEAIAGQTVTASGIEAEMQPLSKLLQQVQKVLPGQATEMIVVQHYGDRHAVAELMGQIPGSLAYYPSASFHLASGDLIKRADWSQESPAKQLYAMVTPLHYASYAGTSLKVLYLALGLGCSLLTITGLRIWQTRPQSARAIHHQRLIDNLITGTCTGLPLAMLALLLIHHLLPADISTDDDQMTLILLFSWGICLLWPWLRGPRCAQREQLGLTSLCLLACPVINRIGSELPFPDTVQIHDPALITVDLCSLGSGALLLVYLYITRKRAHSSHTVQP